MVALCALADGKAIEKGKIQPGSSVPHKQSKNAGRFSVNKMSGQSSQPVNKFVRYHVIGR